MDEKVTGLSVNKLCMQKALLGQTTFVKVDKSFRGPNPMDALCLQIMINIIYSFIYLISTNKKKKKECFNLCVNSKNENKMSQTPNKENKRGGLEYEEEEERKKGALIQMWVWREKW